MDYFIQQTHIRARADFRTVFFRRGGERKRRPARPWIYLDELSSKPSPSFDVPVPPSALQNIASSGRPRGGKLSCVLLLVYYVAHCTVRPKVRAVIHRSKMEFPRNAQGGGLGIQCSVSKDPHVSGQRYQWFVCRNRKTTSTKEIKPAASQEG